MFRGLASKSISLHNVRGMIASCRIANPRNPRKLSPSKISRYTVYNVSIFVA